MLLWLKKIVSWLQMMSGTETLPCICLSTADDTMSTMRDLMTSNMMKNGGGNDCIDRWEDCD